MGSAAKEEAAGDLRGRNVAVLDFSFDKETTARQLASTAGYAVLDHHKSAEESLSELPEHAKIFEMRMSGATLAWNFFHPGEPCPLLARYVKIKTSGGGRTRARRSSAPRMNSRSSCHRRARQKPAEAFRALHALFVGKDAALQALLRQGQTLLKYQDSLVKSAVDRASLRRLKQFPELLCWVVNSTVLQSEIGNVLMRRNEAQEEEDSDEHELASATVSATGHAAFAFVFKVDAQKGELTASLRSCFPHVPGQVDVSKIAAAFGGGGHQAAAGFRFKTTDLETLLVPLD